MNVRIIKKSNVHQHIGNNKAMLKCFEVFFDKLKYVQWAKPQDVIKTFKSADLVTCKKGNLNRIVFNIGRNRYRLICGYWFGRKDVVLYVKFVGTHKEYDYVDVCEIEMFK